MEDSEMNGMHNYNWLQYKQLMSRQSPEQLATQIQNLARQFKTYDILDVFDVNIEDRSYKFIERADPFKVWCYRESGIELVGVYPHWDVRNAK